MIRPLPAATFTPASVISYPLPLVPAMVYHRGDDLEDDFMPDETVALSEDEGFGSFVGDQDDVGTLLSADEEEKAEVKSPSERTKAPSEEKKRKRREKEKERKEKKRKLNETTESGDLTSVALRSPGMISEYLSIMQARSFSKMSALELQDRHIPGRELYSGHDYMDGIEELGHFSGFYRSNGPLTPHSITTEDQITWSTHTTLFNRGGFACSECDPCPQEQNIAR